MKCYTDNIYTLWDEYKKWKFFKTLCLFTFAVKDYMFMYFFIIFFINIFTQVFFGIVFWLRY